LRRVVTVGGTEVRTWRIPTFSLQPIGKLDCNPSTIAASSDGRRVAFDCTNGAVKVIDRLQGASGLQTLHVHDNFAYGITWRGNEICSSGWDGKVICTDVVTRRTMVIADYSRPVRFVHSAGDVLAYAVEDGSVWTHTAGSATPKLLYKHPAEPFQVAVSPSGNIASGAHDGSVITYEKASGLVRVAKTRHTGRVHEVSWRGDELRTSSWDGTTRTWNRDLTVTSTAKSTLPLRQLRLLESGWVASVGATRMWIRSDGDDLELETGPFIRGLSVSTDQRFIGALVSGDLIIYDVREKSLASVRVGDASIKCAQFADATTILACGPLGEIVSLSVDTLPFVKLHNK